MQTQVVGVNDVNAAIIPFSEGSNILREQDMKGNPVTHHITDRCTLMLSKTLLGACMTKLLSLDN